MCFDLHSFACQYLNRICHLSRTKTVFLKIVTVFSLIPIVGVVKGRQLPHCRNEAGFTVVAAAENTETYALVHISLDDLIGRPYL